MFNLKNNKKGLSSFLLKSFLCLCLFMLLFTSEIWANEDGNNLNVESLHLNINDTPDPYYLSDARSSSLNDKTNILAASVVDTLFNNLMIKYTSKVDQGRIKTMFNNIYDQYLCIKHWDEVETRYFEQQTYDVYFANLKVSVNNSAQDLLKAAFQIGSKEQGHAYQNFYSDCTSTFEKILTDALESLWPPKS